MLLGRERRHPAPSVHSPDRAFVAAPVWVSNGVAYLGSLIVAIRGVRGRDGRDQEAVGFACLPMCPAISQPRLQSDRLAPSLALPAARSSSRAADSRPTVRSPSASRISAKISWTTLPT